MITNLFFELSIYILYQDSIYNILHVHVVYMYNIEMFWYGGNIFKS